MDNFAKLPAEDRDDAFRVSAQRLAIGAALIEKDFWVCWTLRRLFTLQNPPTGILFKGGTSLSKVFKAIERFSEDIDLSLDRAALGFGGDEDPAAAQSRKQRDKRLADLSDACRTTIQNDILPKLIASFTEALGNTTDWRLESATDDPDGQTLLFYYPQAGRHDSAYIRPTVRLEFGARSDHWPAVDAEVTPYAAEDFPQLFQLPAAKVRVLSGERTFWEKATALHAWHHSTSAIVTDRRSRHYYDVVRLYEHAIGKIAIQDMKLLRQVAEHKASFFASAAAHYDLAKPGSFCLLPPATQIDALRRDYQSMSEMFFGEPPDFDHLLTVLAEIEQKINTTQTQ